MTTETNTLEQNPQQAVYGKLFGIIQYRHQLKTLSNSLAAMITGEIEVLDASGGIDRGYRAMTLATTSPRDIEHHP